MAPPPFEDHNPGEGSVSRHAKEPEPIPAQITKAVEFLSDLLRPDPQLTRDVERAARQQGHAKRTLDRARALLGVQQLPPEQFRGPWRIALKDDPAVAAYKRRKDAKHQEARQR